MMQAGIGQPKKPCKRKATGIQHRSHEDDHVGDDRYEGEGLTHRRAVTLGQKFRDGHHLRSQQKRHKNVDHEQECKDVQPLVEGGTYPQEICRAHHADELLGADVCRNVAGTDHIPSKSATGQKIVCRGGTFTASSKKSNQRQRRDE